MFKIDCSFVPTEFTDFAFDHIKDDVDDPEALELDYDSQIVTVNTGDMDYLYTVRDTLQERSRERASDMLFEAKNGYNVGYSVEELRLLKKQIRSFEAEQAD